MTFTYYIFPMDGKYWSTPLFVVRAANVNDLRVMLSDVMYTIAVVDYAERRGLDFSKPILFHTAEVCSN